MTARIILVVLVLIQISALAQDKPAYKIFTSKGHETDYGQMLKTISNADVIFFGEVHNNSVSHWLELQTLKDVYANHKALILAMEMFEADDQIVLDEYLNNSIEEKHLLKEAKLWDNYKTDYRPLVEFAKQKKLTVIASNVPRRYASLVYKRGLPALDSLSPEAKRWIAPLPVAVDLQLKGYKELISGMSGHSRGNGENLAKSQAIKDATMAHFIKQNRPPGHKVLHVNGAYHSQNGEGIIWYLKKMDADVSIATIHVVEQDTIQKLEDSNQASADFIICIPSDFTKTY